MRAYGQGQTMSRHPPRVSVVIPTYNGERTVHTAVASVYAQTLADWELIVVDDGSTDRTASVTTQCARDERLRLVQKPNGGLSSARNYGLEHARGEFVAFLDCDDALMPNYLEALLARLRQAPAAGFAYTDAWVFDDRTRRVRSVTAMEMAGPPTPPPSDPNVFLIDHLERNFVFVATTVRRELFNVVGGFREDLTSLEDYEMWLRLSANGRPGVQVPGPLALYRRSRSQMSADRHRMLSNAERVYGQVLEYPGLSPEAQRVARRRLETVRASLVNDTRLADRTWRRGRNWLERRWHDHKPGLWLRDPPQQILDVFGDLREL